MRHAIALALALVFASSAAASRGSDSWIAFAANRAPALTGHLFRVGLDGRKTDLARGAQIAAFNYSPDGRWLAFVDARGLFVEHLDGTGYERLASVHWVAPTAQPLVAWSPDSRRLLVTKNSALYLAGPGQPTRLLAHDATGAVWSPNGRLLAYASLDASYGTRWAIADLAGHVVRRTATSMPPWPPPKEPAGLYRGTRLVSPDHSLVALVTAPTDEGSRLELSVRGRAGLRTLARFGRCTADGGLVNGLVGLRFTPDSHALVYATWCNELPADIYVVHPNGTGLHRLTSTTADEQQPSWSPDGSQIAYSRAEAVGLSCKGCADTIWVMNADGSRARELTFPPSSGGCSFDGRPRWSPDGTQIEFTHATCSYPSKSMVVPLAGGSPKPAPSVARQWEPKHATPKLPVTGVRSTDWSPDGRQIALVVAVDGDFELYTIAPNGKQLTRITTNMGVYPDVSWR